MSGPQINAGDITDWPILKIDYLTDKDKVAALSPPAISPPPPIGSTPLNGPPVPRSEPPPALPSIKALCPFSS